ncbi:MAG: SRPBCC domain-containing protein [Gemmatimonadota bacterium]|jgi:uncharacterized protein YndB with AHSA1/START domain
MTTKIQPVRSEVVVSKPPDRAFRRFTAEIGTWWPAHTHSVSGEACRDVVMEGRVGGRLFEIDGEGREEPWGEVTVWEPPSRVAFTWHPGRSPTTAQRVDVSFEPEEGGTRVVLVHSGWEALGEGATDMRDQYVPGWENVLDHFRRGSG